MMVTLEIEKTHIEDGAITSEESCPIALSVLEITKGNCQVRVYTECLNLRLEAGINSVDIEIPLPENARKFIDDFDRGNEVDPFSFTVAIPDKFLRQYFLGNK